MALSGTSLSPRSERSSAGAVLLAFDRFFHFSERGSTFSREILAGMTTFSTMSYVLVVHPLVLSAAGMDRGALITATLPSAADSPETIKENTPSLTTIGTIGEMTSFSIRFGAMDASRSAEGRSGTARIATSMSEL